MINVTIPKLVILLIIMIKYSANSENSNNSDIKIVILVMSKIVALKTTVKIVTVQK